LNARLARLQEEVNRLTAMVHEKELALECNALQLQRNTDELMRWERENAALRTTLSDEKNLVAVTLRENERLDNEMRFLKAELDYRRGEVDEISGREEETAALLKKKDDENAQLFVRLKVLEDEREELNAKLQLSGLRHRTLYAGDVPLRRHRRGVISRLFAWLSKPILVIGHIPE
jgi:chromosome segregation ATPase